MNGSGERPGADNNGTTSCLRLGIMGSRMNSSWLRSLAAVTLLFCGFAGAAESAARPSAATPLGQAAKSDPVQQGFLRGLYFYPFYSRESWFHQFDRDWIIADATTHFPAIKEMSGIAIILDWAQLCPTEGHCDFAMIDQILEFWRQRGKKVILSVATTGAPIEKVEGNKREFVSATPDWVLGKVATFQSESNNFKGAFLDWRSMANNSQYQYAFPRYDDPHFMEEVEKLVRSLGERYDGNPAIAYMRIATGKGGEDNPYGRTNGMGAGTGMPGFTNSLFISFSRRVTDSYLENFRKTRLEFDIGWTAIVAAGVRNATPITPAEQQQARQLLDYIIDKKIFVAYNGVAPRPRVEVRGATAANPDDVVCPGYSPRPDQNTPAGSAAAYAVLARLKQNGIPFGLEGNALSDPCQSPQRIGAILEFYKPARFVFFGDAAAVINFFQEGMNDSNRDEVKALTNVFVPWTNAAEFPTHLTEATPQIKQFGNKMDRLLREVLVAR
jgi:hypothetical protein